MADYEALKEIFISKIKLHIETQNYEKYIKNPVYKIYL